MIMMMKKQAVTDLEVVSRVNARRVMFREI